MEYLSSIIWLVSWPLVIYISYKLIEWNIKKI
jgi:hypothetical protein